MRSNTLAWVQDFLSRRIQQVTLEGVSSTTAPVTSGVRQGAVLGPLLFLAYINDLPECVSSPCRLFADDSLLYRVIKTPQYAKILQDDLDKLQDWEKKWLMEFNADKCEVLRISNKRTIHEASYTIHGFNLTLTKKAKYLGSILRRNLHSCPRSINETCYKSLVRPQLEYASTVWDPYTKSNTNALKMVQRRAARFVSGNYRRQANVGTMLQSFGWEYKWMRCSKKQCCKQCGQVRFMGTMTKWPVQTHTEHHKTRSIQRRNRNKEITIFCVFLFF